MASKLLFSLPLLGLVCIASGMRYHQSLRPVEHPGRVKRGAIECDEADKYRTADSTCNNLKKPELGSANQVYTRLIKPKSNNVPRLKSVNKEDLPSARLISTRIHKPEDKPMTKGSVMLMEWGQFLAHDLAATAADDGTDCCGDIESLVINGDAHPDIEEGGQCFPIIIPENDRYFTTNETRCMPFSRSARREDDKGREQQINTISAFVDGGMVYGSSYEATDALRSKKGGKLLVENEKFLPKSTEFSCIVEDEESSKDYCMHAGDFRVNAYPGLGAMHTIFMRYHNYIANQLAAVHEDYDDEKLFQEARRIVIAVLQRITFNEYLPLVIGKKAMKTHGLNDDWAYDKSCDPSIANAFATAAFRFGHSMVPDYLKINNEKVADVDLFDRPSYVLQSLDSLVLGLVKNKGQKADRYFSTGMTDQLFEVEPQGGFDIVSRNIQRGRDHSLPPYNEYREHCGLKLVDKFQKLAPAFEKVYADVNDIDLYSGGISEAPVKGGTVGPTFACLIGKQFANLRKCDRFFYENTDSAGVGFTEKQLNHVKRTRLSHVLCQAGVVTKVQKNVFKVADDKRNALEKCDDLLANKLDVGVF